MKTIFLMQVPLTIISLTAFAATFKKIWIWHLQDWIGAAPDYPTIISLLLIRMLFYKFKKEDFDRPDPRFFFKYAFTKLMLYGLVLIVGYVLTWLK